MSECSVQTLKWGATWPSREQFHELADQGYRVIPIVRRLLADSLTPVGFYERLAGGRSGTFILESAEFGGAWSRYSFIGVNSMAQLRSNNGKADWLHGGFSKPIYRHYKGNFYEYLGEVTDSETSEAKVAYQAVCGQHEVWVRPKEMFFGNVEVDGKPVPRFEKVDLKDLEKQTEKSNGQRKD